MSGEIFFKCEIRSILTPHAHNIIYVFILVLIIEDHVIIFVNNIMKHTKSKLKLQLVLVKFLDAQSILNRKLIELGVIIVAHNDELIYAI